MSNRMLAWSGLASAGRAPELADPRVAAPDLMVAATPVVDAPAAGADSLPRLPATSFVASEITGVAQRAEAGWAAAGALFATENIGMVLGNGTSADTGASGGEGGGMTASARSAERPVAGRSEAGADGAPTAFARPLGGYQTRPQYPDGARRQRIEGVVLLEFEILATGRVGSILVDRSAGHRDLDNAAIEAVRTWRFEPARRGDEPVSVHSSRASRSRCWGSLR